MLRFQYFLDHPCITFSVSILASYCQVSKKIHFVIWFRVVKKKHNILFEEMQKFDRIEYFAQDSDIPSQQLETPLGPSVALCFLCASSSWLGGSHCDGERQGRRGREEKVT